jgi:predicted acylesterase/phospholipase RssA
MENIIQNIRHVSGTSMGAFFGAAIALNIPYTDLEQIIKDFTKQPPRFDAANILQLMTTFGLDNGDFLVEPLRKYIRNTYGTNDITFIELTKKTGKHLVVCATCVETLKPVYFSVDTTPDLGVLDAVQASMTVPVLVRPKKIGDNHYCDGAVTDNIPVCPFRGSQSLLVIRVTSDMAQPPPNVMTSFTSYLYALMHAYCAQTTKCDEKITWLVVLNKCPLSFLPMKFCKDGMEVDMSDKDVDASTLYGYEKLQEWLLDQLLEVIDESH